MTTVSSNIGNREDDLLTAREVAEWLRIRPDTVREMCREGRLECFRLGDGGRTHVRIPRAAVHEFIRTCRESADAR